MAAEQHNAYEALNEVDEADGHWAFGSGFDDPLAGVDTTLPDGVDGEDLAAYCLMLGDDALVLSQRLSEWIAAAPELEEDVAIANIALDLLGQARLLLARAGLADGSDRSEDDLAYLRDPRELRNVTLAEVPNGDFARSSARLLVMSAHRLAVLERLVESRDPVLAAIAAKGVKELAYHRDWAARWVVRLGDGTEVSREKMVAGLAEIWMLIGELFATTDIERRMAEQGVGVDPSAVRDDVELVLAQVLDAALMEAPGPIEPGPVRGRAGEHTDDLTELLTELQGFARAHPGASW
jgi:ring-1,2-phenylacetyl-CoA epoxidase subunit PaaC